MILLKNSYAIKALILILGDMVISIASFYAGVFIRFNTNDMALQEYYPLLPRGIIFMIFAVLICFFMDLYDIEKRDGRKELISKIIISGAISLFILAAFFYFIPILHFGRGMLFLSICILVLVQSIWHIGYEWILTIPGGVKRNVLILGTGPFAQTIGTILFNKNNGFALLGYVNCIGEPVNISMSHILGNGDNILDIALKKRVKKIIVSLNERRGTLPVKEILNCKLRGIDVIEGPTFYEQLTGKMLIENMNPSYLIFAEGFRITLFKNYIKRILDFVLSSIAIVLFLPFIIILPVIIKLNSKGPALLKQVRVGKGEKLFTLYKFRTMIDGAEKNTGPVWSQEGDFRITRLGNLLRKTRLDEIPQLFNVMRGDMSFIGPRPERPFFVEALKKQIPYYSERHCVKPGITGWAQVRHAYSDSVEGALEKLRYDLYYIKYQSISLDLLIILDTMKVILFGRGGR
jgi:sugar transferase (PEP-CTERM system associated)